MKVGLVGASGFIGSRIVERWILGGRFDVLPIVRSPSSLAVLARFDLPWAVCDVFDQGEVARAVAGCDAVVHAAIGDPKQIAPMAEAIYLGARAAGVRRLIVLSSASVHGQAPAKDTNEDSPLHTRHSLPYNNAKVLAERAVQRLGRDGGMKVVTLRPSVVYGPRSRWIADTANQLEVGRACMINNGDGVCNCIYVDNLILGIEKALEIPAAAGETFLLGDSHSISWREFYEMIAEQLGYSIHDVKSVQPRAYDRPLKERVADWTGSKLGSRILPAIPRRAKFIAKLALNSMATDGVRDGWALPSCPSVELTEEMSLLQQCKWRLSSEKAARVIGYKPEVSTEEGMRRSCEWLRFAGMLHVKTAN